MGHHNLVPNGRERLEMLDACKDEHDLIQDLMDNTDRIQRLFPTVTAKRSQMKRSVGHIRHMWFQMYWEMSERMQLLAYLQKSNQGRAFMNDNY